jgi:DNA-directed RNA polymerase sigma subunit (sigma70/sigma32)
VNCSQSEYLEIAFADKVRDLTRNGVERYKKSSMGNCVELDAWTAPDSKKGAFEFVELRQDVIDTRPDVEDLMILLEDEPRRDELLRRICDAVEDVLDFQALYLFHAEDKSLQEIATMFGTGTREIRYRKDRAMHQIRVALGLETEEKREALRKRQRERRAANRHADSSAKSTRESAQIRPDSRPPSISI